ncbi:MAG: chloride channel protein [Acidimicrobiales bacterium]
MSDEPPLRAPGWWLPRQARLIPLSVVVGLMSGAASAEFLRSLEWATDVQTRHDILLWVLPVVGAVMVAVQLRWGGTAPQGNLLTMRQIRRIDGGVPLRMAPFAYVGTVATHLFGGSAGREGTALQMAAGLTDGLASRARLRHGDRQMLLVAALAAGFGSVFGVPWAGAVFAVEIAPMGRWRRLMAVPSCLVAAYVGDRTVAWFGVTHTRYPAVHGVGVVDVAVVALVAPLFGLAAWLFIRLTDTVRDNLRERVSVPWLRPVLGASAVIVLTLALGTRQYNGLSLPLLGRSLGAGAVQIGTIGLGVWLAKLVMTSLTVGSGFAGGEVTPLFVVGATLGAAVGHATGGPVVLLGAVGMMATFGSAVNASLACAVMGVELFGWGPVIPLLVGCGIARLFSSGRSLYVHEHVPDEARFV